MVLKYRTNTPREPDQKRFDFNIYPPEVVKDGRKAVQVLRSLSDELNIDPGKIGMMGFSAGGHLAIILALSMDDDAIPPEKIIGFFQYLVQSGADAELHIYGKGPHGRGMSEDPLVGLSMRMWPESYIAWIKDISPGLK